MNRAAAFVRVSDREQVEGYSLDAQRVAIEGWCERKGLQLVSVYADEGVSARYDDFARRPQFRAWLEAAEAGAFDVAVVHTLDRFARNLKLKLAALERLSKAGVGFASVTEDMDYTSAHGRLFLQQMGAYNEFFSNMLAVHVKKGLRQRAREGLLNGDVPFGYRRCRLEDGCPGERCRGGVHVEPLEAEALRRAFSAYLDGATQTELARSLNAEGFRTRNKIDRGRGSGPQPFTTWSLRDILGNPFYAGKVRWARSEEFDGQHEALIDETTFARVLSMKAERKGRSKTFTPSTRPYLLKGLLACSLCGERYWSEQNHGVSMYRGARRGQGCACESRMLRCEEVDARVGLLVYALTLPDEVLTTAFELEASTRGDDGRIEARRKTLEEKRRRLGAAYVDGVYGEAEYRRELSRLTQELAALGSANTAAPEDAIALLSDIEALWQDATVEERRMLLSKLIDGLYVTPEGQIAAVSPRASLVPAFARVSTKAGSGVRVEAVPSPPHQRNEGSATLVGWRRGSVGLRPAADSLQPWERIGPDVRERYGLHFVVMPEEA